MLQTKENDFLCTPYRHFHNPAENLYVVILHRKMSRKVPDFNVNDFMFSVRSFDGIYIGETHFQIRGLMAEVGSFFEYGDTTSGTLGKTWFTC